MSEYFDANLFIPQLSAKSKLDALEKITSHIRQYRDIPDDFLDYIIRREQLMSTSFNEEVAFPHPSELITNETFACVAILENPIMWGDYKIRVVFLVSIEKTREKNLKEFYMALSRIMNNRENIRRLVNDPTYLTFMEILKRVN
ncbi:putative licABCH operon regulator [bioreactor metagenome]|uniref:Putative licABCH operon regulator n=1 Tax=bioreactor metagenome TaxID=1076179 RepID=A0A645IJ08_9ZZZZ